MAAGPMPSARVLTRFSPHGIGPAAKTNNGLGEAWGEQRRPRRNAAEMVSARPVTRPDRLFCSFTDHVDGNVTRPVPGAMATRGRAFPVGRFIAWPCRSPRRRACPRDKQLWDEVSGVRGHGTRDLRPELRHVFVTFSSFHLVITHH